MTVNAFMSDSLDPPLVLVSVRKKAKLLERVGLGGVVGINFLAQGQEAVGEHFGGRGRQRRFAYGAA